MHPLTELCLLTLVTALASLPLATGLKPNCEPHILDNCSKTLIMLGDDNFVFPTAIDHMNKRCKEIKTLEKCIKDYTTRCLNGDTKNSFSVVVFGISKTNKGYCSSVKRKNAFISFGHCANRHKKRLDKYMEQMSRDFQGARMYGDPKLRLPLACCNYYKFKENALSYLSKDCPVEAEEVENLIDGYARDGLNLLCGDYAEDSDKCSQIIGKTPKWTKALSSKVFMLPLVEILNSL